MAHVSHSARRLFLVLSCFVLSGCEMSESDYLKLLTRADSAMSVRQARLKKEFQLGAYKRFDYDEASGIFVFSDSGVARVLADAQFVGDVSRRDSTFRWAWDLPWLASSLTSSANRARYYGWLHGIRRLRDSEWPGGEGDGWEMTALTGWLGGSEGGYRAPSSDSSTYTFVLLHHVRWAPPNTTAKSYIRSPRADSGTTRTR